MGGEERSPEPKPRWNPRPEQIRILESIFNSGMVNPPRDEIRRIRAQLQEYGQVGDANVFYWFQNRKSRTKHKLRHPTTTTSSKSKPKPNPTSTSSSSSSDASSFSLQHPQNAVVLNAPPPLPLNENNNNSTAAYSSSFYGQFVPFITEAAVVEQGGMVGFPSDLLTFLHHHQRHEDDQTVVGDYLLSEMKEDGGGAQQQKMMLSYSVNNNNASATTTADQIHPTTTHNLFVPPPPPLPGTCSNVAAPTINQSHQGNAICYIFFMLLFFLPRIYLCMI